MRSFLTERAVRTRSKTVAVSLQGKEAEDGEQLEATFIRIVLGFGREKGRV